MGRVLKKKQVWNTLDATPEVAWESSLEEDVFHHPANTVEVAPPNFDSQSQLCAWNGSEWIVSEIPPEPELEPPPAPEVSTPEPPPIPDLEIVPPEPFVPTTYDEKRSAEYGSPQEQIEFITENGLEAWQEKVTGIKAKYPKPE